jgi:type III pantothenate kinase
MILLIDIGNTRIKWAMLDNGHLVHQHAVAHAALTEDECSLSLAVLPAPHRVLVSNVGGERIGGVVRNAVLARWDIEPSFVRSTAEAAGVRNAYPDVWRLGVDRWVGIVGAYSMHRRAVCVLGIGTAATIDAVDSTGRHWGGVIVPGPNLMVSSLLENTSGIASRAESGSIDDGIFANNTFGAIHQGSLHALAALAERAVAMMRAQTDEDPLLILTGGRAADIARLISHPHMTVPDLVLRGLAVLATAPEA